MAGSPTSAPLVLPCQETSHVEGALLAQHETDAKRLVSAISREGVLMGLTGNHGNVLKLRPPLPFSRDNADHALEVVDRCLRAMRLGHATS